MRKVTTKVEIIWGFQRWMLHFLFELNSLNCAALLPQSLSFPHHWHQNLSKSSEMECTIVASHTHTRFLQGVYMKQRAGKLSCRSSAWAGVQPWPPLIHLKTCCCSSADHQDPNLTASRPSNEADKCLWMLFIPSFSLITDTEIQQSIKLVEPEVWRIPHLNIIYNICRY